MAARERCRRWAEPPVRVRYWKDRGMPGGGPFVPARVDKYPDARGEQQDMWEGRICGGTRRTLYVRTVEERDPKGWAVVGAVCVGCGHMELDQGALPYDPSTLAGVRVLIPVDGPEPPPTVPWPPRVVGGYRL
jgi:hypothetical protein